MPPTPEEVDAFLADDRPDAYERLIDRLLASPRYGQRWGRHWLDLVRYAESDGYRQDAFRPHAWRYRDYVVRAFNTDKPYDRFLTEQLAGDELDPDDPELRVATGYLRLGTYEYNQRNVRGQWADILNDITDVTGEVFLGLEHRLRPLPRPQVRPDPPEGLLPAPGVLHSALAPRRPDAGHGRASGPSISRSARPGRKRRPTSSARSTRSNGLIATRGRATAIAKFPDEIKAILRKPEQDRSPLERQLGALAFRQIAYEHDQVPALLKGTDKARWDELHKALKRYDALRPVPPDPVLTATDLGPVSPPTVIPGDRKQEPIEPGFLSVLDPAPARIEPSPGGPAIDRAAAGPGSLAEPARQSAFDPRDRQPGLAVPFRPGPGRHVERLRPPGRGSQPPRAARLAGDRVRRARLAAEAAAPADPDFGGLSPVAAAQPSATSPRPSGSIPRIACSGNGRSSGSTPRRSATPCWPPAASSSRRSAARACPPRSRGGRSILASIRNTRDALLDAFDAPDGTFSTATPQHDHDGHAGPALDQWRLDPGAGQGPRRSARATRAISRPTTGTGSSWPTAWPSAAQPEPDEIARGHGVSRIARPSSPAASRQRSNAGGRPRGPRRLLSCALEFQ